MRVMGPVGVGLPRCDRVWAAVESFFDPIQLCKRSFPVSVLHEFWVTGHYNSDTSNFQLLLLSSPEWAWSPVVRVRVSERVSRSNLTCLLRLPRGWSLRRAASCLCTWTSKTKATSVEWSTGGPAMTVSARVKPGLAGLWPASSANRWHFSY